MSNLSILSQIGCFVAENVLTAEECRELRAKSLSSKIEAATTVNSENEIKLNEAVRKTKNVEIDYEMQHFLFKKIMSLKPQVEEFFSIELERCQTPQLLIYLNGDYFKVHRDVNEENVSNPVIADRKISTVIFLNEQTPEPQENCFGGGALNLYGLIDQPAWQDKAFPIKGQTGLLIAFRSTVLHEVTEVTHGERFTVVDWFY